MVACDHHRSSRYDAPEKRRCDGRYDVTEARCESCCALLTSLRAAWLTRGVTERRLLTTHVWKVRDMERENRRRFLTKAGAATGAAAFVGIPGLGKPELAGASHAPAVPAGGREAPGGLAPRPPVGVGRGPR